MYTWPDATWGSRVSSWCLSLRRGEGDEPHEDEELRRLLFLPRLCERLREPERDRFRDPERDLRCLRSLRRRLERERERCLRERPEARLLERERRDLQ